ncbi:Hypothetical predicted protein [Olea europaea subsp. europaea]|uniref:Uncharacterized protein n=1 Tax=Olea europaea subsp. europaea TaxID=158383 RepID=A0A8S0QC44_OLEEU|nr:Hypothetical predicted protein [Olea europaea subsp. europaea]
MRRFDSGDVFVQATELEWWCGCRPRTARLPHEGEDRRLQQVKELWEVGSVWEVDEDVESMYCATALVQWF